MKKIILLAIAIFLLFSPLSLNAQGGEEVVEEATFKARVIEILESKKTTREDGSISIQQKIKLRGLEDEWKDKEIIFDGTQHDVISSPEYKEGNKVLVNSSLGMDGEENYYIIGYQRTGSIYWLALIFALVVIVIGRLKGLRALVVLLLTFFIILKFIIPEILDGGNPLLISIIGSLFILVLSIYITEGIKKSSTIAIISVLISLVVTGVISVWFTTLTKLTGFASDEAMYLVGLAGGNVNIKGLLLAGIIIGALGVLDDVVVSQVSLVKELKEANPKLPKRLVYSQAMRVGISHLSSMVNTLFLAYAGAALPLLILFSIKEPPFFSFHQVINNEIIATEIVRSLTGSIGLVLAVPIATLLAVHFVKSKE